MHVTTSMVFALLQALQKLGDRTAHDTLTEKDVKVRRFTQQKVASHRS